QKIVKPGDARINVVADLDRLDPQRPVDVLDLGADVVGELGAARVDDPADVGDALVERAHHFVAALGDFPGDVRDAGGERLAERLGPPASRTRSEEHTSELQSLTNLVCRLLLEKKNKSDSNSDEPHHPRRNSNTRHSSREHTS